MEEMGNSAVQEAGETTSILEEYKQKFAHAIERDKERLREIAEEESLAIITRAKEESEQIITAAKERATKEAKEEAVGIVTVAEQEAQQIADKRIIEVQKESAKIVSQSRELADQILNQAERLVEVATELKEKVKNDIDKVTEKLQREVDTFTEAKQKTERNIIEARKTVQKEFEESVGVITEAKQKLEQVIAAAEHETKKELEARSEPLASTPSITQEREEVVEPAATVGLNSASREATDDKLYVGTLELDITPPANSAQMERLQKCLWKVPSVQVLSVAEFAGKKTSVSVFLAKPLPMLNILREMSVIAEAVQHGKNIQVVLETGFG